MCWWVRRYTFQRGANFDFTRGMCITDSKAACTCTTHLPVLLPYHVDASNDATFIVFLPKIFFAHTHASLCTRVQCKCRLIIIIIICTQIPMSIGDWDHKHGGFSCAAPDICGYPFADLSMNHSSSILAAALDAATSCYRIKTVRDPFPCPCLHYLPLLLGVWACGRVCVCVRMKIETIDGFLHRFIFTPFAKYPLSMFALILLSARVRMQVCACPCACACTWCLC